MDWKGLVGKVAPILGTALGGPFGGMAGKFLADKLGVPEEDLPETIENASPDVMLQIKSLDADFKVKMKELGLKEKELEAEDRANARNLAIQTTIWPQVILSVVYTVAYAAVLWAYISGNVQVPENAQAQFSIVLGVLTAAQAQILNFWFGSSSGSKEKDRPRS